MKKNSSINNFLFGFIHVAFSIMIALLVLYGALRFGTVAFDFGYRVFTEKAVDEENGKNVMVTVSDDMTSLELGEMLQEKGLIRDGRLFAVQMELSIYSMKEEKGKKQIQPGTYTLSTSLSTREMMAVMAEIPEVSTEAEEEGSTEEGTEASTENSGGDKN